MFAIHELLKYLFAIHELWKQGNICITWIMKTLKCLFAVHWIMKIFVCNAWIMKCPLKHMNYENRKISVCNKWIMKNENVCLQNMNYEHLCLHYMNYENILFKIHELWKNVNVCTQCMNYEDIFCNTWIIKIRKSLFALHELWKK